MRIRSVFGAGAMAFALLVVGAVSQAQGAMPVGGAQAQDDAGEPKADLKPEVAALLKQSTSVYAAMRSYRHISEFIQKGQAQDGEINRATTFTLALERPNKFCYKSDGVDGSAAVSNGKTFISYQEAAMPGRQRTYYTKIAAPASYKGINLADDVNISLSSFNFGSYFVALMLQGDALADPNVRAGLADAIPRLGVEENGKKYDLLTATFQGRSMQDKSAHNITARFYFDAATHLLRKTVSTVSEENITYTEIMENVLIDKPIPAATFEYSPPKNARMIVGLPLRTRRQAASIAVFPIQRLDVGSLLAKPDACFGPSF